MAKVGDKKQCIANSCKEEAICLASYPDCCMGTLDEIEMEEWECPHGHKWKQGAPE